MRGNHQEQWGRQQPSFYLRVGRANYWQKRVGLLVKENPNGPFAEEWKKAYDEIAKDSEEIAVAGILSNAALAIKDEKELVAIRDASRASCRIIKDYFVDEMSGILDDEKKVSNSKLATQLADKIDDSSFFKKMKVSETFDPMNLDWATQPIVQSGGSYDLQFQTEPDDKNLDAGIIIAALGLRYQSYACWLRELTSWTRRRNRRATTNYSPQYIKQLWSLSGTESWQRKFTTRPSPCSRQRNLTSRSTSRRMLVTASALKPKTRPSR